MFKKLFKKFISEVTWVRYVAPYLVNFKNTKRKFYAKSGEHPQLFGPLSLNPSAVELDDYTRLQPGVRIINAGGKLVVKKYSAVGADSIVIASEHVPTVGLPQFLSTLHINDVKATVVIEEDAWVGAGCILLSHSKIGRGAVVAAGSVVTKPVPPYAVVAGSPAKIIAARFTMEQIIKHEQILYPREERISHEALQALFDGELKDKKSIGVSEMSQGNYDMLEEYKKNLGIKNYENS